MIDLGQRAQKCNLGVLLWAVKKCLNSYLHLLPRLFSKVTSVIFLLWKKLRSSLVDQHFKVVQRKFVAGLELPKLRPFLLDRLVREMDELAGQAFLVQGKHL